MHDLSTTLAAVATAPGRGGVACLRISGPEAVRIGRALFRPGRAATDDPSRPCFGTFVDGNGARLDHGYLVLFEAARAFTGEPTAELWCHGSPPILEALTRAAVGLGASIAGPGEFTYRALRRGRIDLPRAEAIRDLVAARTAHQARVAFAQMEGALSRRLAPLREALIDLVARAEAAIEFADEAETHLPEAALSRELERALALVRTLVEEGRRGRVVREGARVTLTGKTSVGKSSIFNKLLGRERAIVSAVAGTTRDTLEETIDLDGIAVTLTDTAGLRPAEDAVETEGVRRARVAAGEADLLIRVLDASRPLGTDEILDLVGDRTRPVASLVVANKIDLLAQGAPPPYGEALGVSATTGAGIECLRRSIREAVTGAVAGDDPVVTNVRHLAALEEAEQALLRARASSPVGLEVAVEDLRAALEPLAELAGEVAQDDLYDRIFSTFCIGK